MRLINFAAGPAMLPTVLLERASQQILEWQDYGFSILEANHRGPEFGELIQQTERDLRQVCQIPKNYKVLFLLAPARAHFAAIPLNLSAAEQTADYLVSGLWSDLAAGEAEKYCQVQRHQLADSYTIDDSTSYFYYTDNETVHGIYTSCPTISSQVPIACDMTSSLLTRPIEIEKYGVIFAGVQKNIAPSGLSLVIIRDDLLHRARAITPSVLDYSLQAEQGSLLNTNNNFSIFMTGLMLQWINEQGGLAAIHQRNIEKASKLYHFIDEHEFYHNPVSAAQRSILNVVFQLAEEDSQAKFLEMAKQAGMIGLKGHRKVGGMRASLYNAISLADVDKLIDFMQDFATQ